jgi:hypothetical protein
MSDKRQLREEMSEFERDLQSLSPRPSGVDRDRLMFLAGQASATADRENGTAVASSRRRNARFWQTATAVLSLTTIGLATALWQQPAPQVVERIVYLPLPVPDEQTAPVIDTPAAVAAPLEAQRSVAQHAGASNDATASTPPASESHGLRQNVLPPENVAMPRLFSSSQGNRDGAFKDAPAVSSPHYLHLRQQVLEHGLDALPESRIVESTALASAPLTRQEMLAQLLEDFPKEEPQRATSRSFFDWLFPATSKENL